MLQPVDVRHIQDKIRNGPNGILRVLRETDSWKKPKAKNLVTLSLQNTMLLQPVDVRQIQDKFPEKKEGLKELYEKGPQEAFFLVKFWADLNTNIADDTAAFYGVTTTWVFFGHFLWQNEGIKTLRFRVVNVITTPRYYA